MRNWLQASSYVLHVNENDTLSEAPQLFLFSNLPITCQYIFRDRPLYCWLKFVIRSDSRDVAMRAIYPGISSSRSKPCLYQMDETDWKPDEGLAYDYSKLLQIIAKVWFLEFR